MYIMSSCGCAGNMVGGAKHKTRKMKKRRVARKGTRKQVRKSRRQLRKHNRKLSRRHRRNRRKSRQNRRSMKGGYHQFQANQPLTNGQQTAGVNISPNDSALANPPPQKAYNNTVDNYNHNTGKGSETPVLDQDVKN